MSSGDSLVGFSAPTSRPSARKPFAALGATCSSGFVPREIARSLRPLVLARSLKCAAATMLFALEQPTDSSGQFGFHRRFCTATHLFPVHVLHKCIDVLRRCRPVIHVISMLVHVQHEQRSAHWRVVHVIPSPVVVKLPGVRIVSKDRSAGASSQRIRSPLELRLPLLIAAKPLFDQIEHGAGGLTFSTEVGEVVFV